MGKSKNKCKCCVQVDQLRRELRQANKALAEAGDKESNYTKTSEELSRYRRRNYAALMKVKRLKAFGPPNEAAFRREMGVLENLLDPPPYRRGPTPRPASETAKPITSSDPVDWDALTRQINEAWARTADEQGKEFRKFRDAYNKKEK